MTDDVLPRLVRRLEEGHFGRYLGRVIDNEDPQRLGRVRVEAPGVLDQAVWAEGVFGMGGNPGEAFVHVPASGSLVTVEFLGGDIAQPIWTGTIRRAGHPPPEGMDTAQSALSYLRSRTGLEIRLSDDGTEAGLSVRSPTGAEMTMEGDGSLALVDESGAGLTVEADEGRVTIAGPGGGTRLTLEQNRLEIQAAGTTITLEGGAVTVEGQRISLEGLQVLLGKQGSTPILNALTFLQMFNVHVHGPPGTPPAPTVVPAAASLQPIKGS